MLTLYKEPHRSENKHYLSLSAQQSFLSAIESCRCLGLPHSHWRCMAYISKLCALCYFFPGNTKAPLHNKHNACTCENTSLFLCSGLRGQEPWSSKPAGGRFFHSTHFSLLAEICPLPKFRTLTSLSVSNWPSNSEARPLELCFSHDQGCCADGISVGTEHGRLVVICVISGAACRLERGKRKQNREAVSRTSQ